MPISIQTNKSATISSALTISARSENGFGDGAPGAGGGAASPARRYPASRAAVSSMFSSDRETSTADASSDASIGAAAASKPSGAVLAEGALARCQM